MSEKYQVKCIYEVYSPYRIKICGHLAYLSFTRGVPDTLTHCPLNAPTRVTPDSDSLSTPERRH